MNREQRNGQFDFLRPQHSLFQYFTRLLEQYTKVLIPPKDLIKKLGFEAESSAAVFKQVCSHKQLYYCANLWFICEFFNIVSPIFNSFYTKDCKI